MGNKKTTLIEPLRQSLIEAQTDYDRQRFQNEMKRMAVMAETDYERTGDGLSLLVCRVCDMMTSLSLLDTTTSETISYMLVMLFGDTDVVVNEEARKLYHEIRSIMNDKDGDDSETA